LRVENEKETVFLCLIFFKLQLIFLFQVVYVTEGEEKIEKFFYKQIKKFLKGRQATLGFSTQAECKAWFLEINSSSTNMH
jgi:hypothetical protein